MKFIKVVTEYDEDMVINTDRIVYVSDTYGGKTDIHYKDGSTYSHIKVKESVDDIFEMLNS